jgi:hypothetical protein
MSQVGKYLYCIVRCGEERAFNDVIPIGGETGLVYTVPHGGLAVVVSDAHTGRYDTTRANMLAHQRVQEKVMRGFTILPVRFGTVADGASPAESVRRLLEKRAEEFERLLSDLEGKVELGLKALWRDEGAVFEEIAAREEGVRRLRDSLSGKPPQATHFERIRLGGMVKEALERRRSAEAAAILAPLRRIACRAVENPVTMDRMVVNVAFLVEREREKEFDQAVDCLDREHGQRVTFRYVGPVPPYNFVNIVVNWSDL